MKKQLQIVNKNNDTNGGRVDALTALRAALKIPYIPPSSNFNSSTSCSSDQDFATLKFVQSSIKPLVEERLKKKTDSSTNGRGNEITPTLQQKQHQEQHASGEDFHDCIDVTRIANYPLTLEQDEEKITSSSLPSTIPPTPASAPFSMPLLPSSKLLPQDYDKNVIVNSSLSHFEHKELDQVAALFRRGAWIGFSIFVILTFIVFRYAPRDSFTAPEGLEQQAHFVSFALLFVTNGSRLAPLLLRPHRESIFRNGVMVATLMVQLIAITSNFYMSVYPSPIVVDPVTGLRIHLLRWCEWTALAFLMTFLTANFDAPMIARDNSSSISDNDAKPSPMRRPKGLTATIAGFHKYISPDSHVVPFAYPTFLGLSTACGLIFPFCSSIWMWSLVMIVSWTLFMPLYVLLAERYTSYQRTHASLVSVSSRDQEHFLITRASFLLCLTCAFTWTGLVVFYCLACATPAMTDYIFSDGIPKDSILANVVFQEVGLCFFEIASKIWYLSILLDVYEKVFDENVQAARRLEELRSFMSAVWKSSTDVIIFCGKTTIPPTKVGMPSATRITARVSPAYLQLVGFCTGRLPYLNRGDVSLNLEIDVERKIFHVFAFDLTKPVSRRDVCRLRESLENNSVSFSDPSNLSPQDKVLAVVAELALEACCSTAHSTCLRREICVLTNFSDEIMNTPCEARINKIDETSSVVVLRDISDRIQRFEAEKQLIREVTVRKKDAETNHFSRHEIKNGILAAIALLDHIRENNLVSGQQQQRQEQQHQMNQGGSVSTLDTVDSTTYGLFRDQSLTQFQLEDICNQSGSGEDHDVAFTELDSTLRDILDTVLDHAMAREIVYGEYEPRKERMNVPEVISSLQRRSSPRFPMSVNPNPFPEVVMDRHLLRYIYRNAASNACKYGKWEGVIQTYAHLDRISSTFVLEVVNLPGSGHDELVLLSDEEIASIFKPGTQLSATKLASGKQAQVIRNESSGNGAWIMQKCAEALGGKCSIHFESERTVFTFTCPVDFQATCDADSAGSDDDEFCLPENIQCIVIDDSSIQRKMMARFLKMAGIPASRCIVLGKDASEIYGFCDRVMQVMNDNPRDNVLIIADENLDITEGGATHETVSGSLCVQQLRQQLNTATESRLLALIRSANDAASDLDLYKARAHGFLLKEPLKKGNVLDIIKPYWIKRFHDKGVRYLASRSHYGVDESSCYGPSKDDIRGSLVVIDALLFTKGEIALGSRWRTIREKLHTLKGDLKTVKSNGALAGVVCRIDNLLSKSLVPENFFGMWEDIKLQIETVF